MFPGVGFIVTFAVISGLKIFYDVNPSYALFPGQNTSPSWDSFSVAMESQVHWQCVAMLIPAILVVSIPFIYRRWRWRSKTTRNTRVRLLVSIAGCGVLVAGLLSVPAINNHHDSLFFDFWRYWTAVPFFLLILLVASARAVPLRERLPSVTPRAMRLTSPVAVVMAGLLACGILVSQGAWLKANEFALVAADGPVAVSPREKVVQSCRDLKQRANAQNVYIALSENDPFLAYGCYALAGINVVNPAEDERRTWLQAYLRQQGMVGITNRPEG
ncbi:unannotated protein [freshwater metagenome]|uniref:Unannotated protein n=1 Tax=freshwater metagenome TaxID=449393 RepID=A0A6J7FAR3_9ZZZZ